jgi:hypothetical protein
MLLRPRAVSCSTVGCRTLRCRTTRLILLSALAAALSLAHASASAQALPTASRSAAISVFGGYLGDLPDYGPYRNNGFSAGVDYTRFFHFPIEPSFELRANIADGKTVNERTYLLGGRAAYRFRQPSLRRLHPYADFLIGIGDIHFNFNNGGYLGDNSIVPSFGGGADYEIARHFSAKIDFQAQHWKTGNNVTYSPSLTIIGVVYTIPFRPHIKQGEISH